MKKRNSKFILFCLLTLCISKLPADQGLKCDNQELLALTVPKAGTHLLRKAISLISKGELEIGKVQHLTMFLISNSIYNNQFVKILMIRDPRDTLISQIFWIQGKNYHWPPHTLVSEEFNQLSFDEQLNYVITFPKESFGVCEYTQMALEWIKDPTVFICRFEDLVGIKGGGDRLRQENTIEALGKHLGYALSSEEITDIADNLFGGTATFRNGQIGTWQNYFSPEHKELFKSVMGKELIELGYAVDENW